MVENLKGCTIQWTINYSAHSNSDEQVDKINDYEEQVDERNWLRNNYAEQVDQINDSDKHVDAIIDSEKKLWPEAIQKSIQTAIQRQLPTLTTEISHKKYWSAGSSQR